MTVPSVALVPNATSSAMDALVLWMSEMQTGTVDDARTTWMWLLQRARDGGDSLKGEASGYLRALRDLQDLGIIELSWSRRRWWAAPAVVSELPDSDGLMLLSGSRPRVIEERLRDWQEAPGALEVAATLNPPDAPSVTYLRTRRDDEAGAEALEAGLLWQGCAAESLLTGMPTLGLLLASCPRVAGPGGLSPEKVDLSGTGERWSPVADDEALGLYRHDRHNPLFLFRHRTGGRLAERRLGTWAELARIQRGVLRFHAERQQLWLPAWAPLPLALARALTARSGLLPQAPTPMKLAAFPSLLGHVGYRNVPAHVAAQLATATGQQLVAV